MSIISDIADSIIKEAEGRKGYTNKVSAIYAVFNEVVNVLNKRLSIINYRERRKRYKKKGGE